MSADLGKVMNGYGVSNYDTVPKGWDHVDGLLEPYIDDYNVPIWSANGECTRIKPEFARTLTPVIRRVACLLSGVASD